MKYIVYNTINTVNLKHYIGVHKTKDPEVFDGYIGCGVNINKPSSYNNPKTPFQKAVKKYGTDTFKRITLRVFDSLEDALDLERWLVCSEFIKRKDTYNVALGGEGGLFYFPINQFNIEGNLLKEWDNAQEVSDFYSVSANAIFNAIRFKGSCVKYFWSKEKTINVKEYSFYSGNECYKYDSDGNFVEMYNSIPEAAKLNEVPMQAIQRSIKGGYCVEGFYYSSELLEEFIKVPKISLKKKDIFIYDLEGNFITTLHTGEEIKEFFNIDSTSCVTTAIRTGRQYRDFQISLEYLEKLDQAEDKRNKRKRVGKFSLTGDLLEEFDSITLACEKFGTGVQKVLRGQQKQCKGFIFNYI